MFEKKEKEIHLNTFTRVEFDQDDIIIMQDGTGVILDHQELEKLFKIIMKDKKININ